ncbi:efflux RND transporter periplasmic adaptor subunit [Methylovirgula sp. HY1]|uniref:efflux RND transporter periplasmic adaptor subunit n=1 Tax=Methylovirgula sp. HY1 TaxID=2822761 RepID=UPI001C5B9C14|nr:efflux RND transporter periplasmic adaptor subunit [Methylovirgula sp. HY1]QXX76537.1 Multidrug export protein EmrA [Methylovirgula sp. HY1]
MSETEALEDKDHAPIPVTPAARFQTAAPILTPTQKPTTNPQRKRLLVLLLVATALGIGGWLYLRLNRAVPGFFVTLYGNVDIREVQPAFNDTGHITRMLVQEGDAIKNSQMIATLDDTRYAATLAQAEGQMRDQEQVLARLLAGSRPEEIAQAKATMDALYATYQNDGLLYDRAVKLMNTSAGTIEQRDNAKAAYDAAHQQYEAAKQAYILAVKGPRKEDISAARALLAADRGAVEFAKRELRDTRLYAASDGIVEDRILEPGDMASPTTPVYTIALMSPLWVRAYIAENDLGKIALGMRATVTTDSFPGQVYHGWVGFISPTAEFTPKTVETPELRTALVYQVRIYVCDARNELRLGMPATVHIDTSRPPPAKGGAGAHSCEATDAGK